MFHEQVRGLRPTVPDEQSEIYTFKELEKLAPSESQLGSFLPGWTTDG